MIIDKHIFTGNANNKNLLRILPFNNNKTSNRLVYKGFKEALVDIQ
jgi:acetylornithine aminotransferase